MQLTITLLSNIDNGILDEIIFATVTHQCHIIDLKSSIFSHTCCAYMLVEGNWNQLSKLESMLYAIKNKFECSIHTHRVELLKNVDVLPMTIEIIGLASVNLLGKIVTYFNEKNIAIEEMNVHCYPAPYLNAQLMAIKFVIALCNDSLFQVRDELMYLCEGLNADLLFEPFKMGV